MRKGREPYEGGEEATRKGREPHEGGEGAT